MKQIKHTRVVVAHGLGAMVTQEMVQIINRLRNVIFALAVDDVDMFARMRLEQAQLVRLG